MSNEKAAEVFVGKPLRVSLDELDRRCAEDAAVPTSAAVAAASAPLGCSASRTPEGPCLVCPRLAAEFEPYRQTAFYKSMHQRALERERLLKEENQQLQDTSR